MSAVGTPVTRVDGPAKVTGAARYSAEISLPGMTYLAVVGASIASGRVTRSTQARRSPPKACWPSSLVRTCRRSPRNLTCSRRSSAARHPARASSRCRTTSSSTRGSRLPSSSPRSTSRRSTPPRWCGCRMRDEGGHHDRPGPRPGLRGATALRRADACAQRARRRRRCRSRRPTCGSRSPTGWRPTTTTRSRPPSTVAVWDGGDLTLYESTQGIRATQQTVAELLGLPIAHVRVSRASSAADSARRRWSGPTSHSPRWPPGTSAGRSS